MTSAQDVIANAVAAIAAGPQGPEVGAFFAFEGAVIDADSLARAITPHGGDAEHPLAAGHRLPLGGDAPDALATAADAMAAAMAGRTTDELASLGRQLLEQRVGAYLYPGAWSLVEAHLRARHTVVLLAASSPFHVASLADDLGVALRCATEVGVHAGACTGTRTGPVLIGAARADAVTRVAAERGLDLTRCAGYGHTDDDVAFLSLVGEPHVVDAEPGLADAARQGGWPMLAWPDQARPGAVDHVRTVATYGALLAAGLSGITVGTVRRNRRAGVDTWLHLAGDLGLAAAGIRVDLTGGDIARRTRPAVIMANHQSSTDFLVLAKVLRGGVSGVAKAELRHAPGIGQAFELMDVTFVDRTGTGQAAQAMAPAVDQLRRGVSMVIFPEGTRAATPRLGRFKKGGFHLAMQAGVPIVPIVLEHPGELMWRGSSTVHAGTVRVTVLDPVPTDGWSTDDLGAHVDEVRARFLDVLGETHLG